VFSVRLYPSDNTVYFVNPGEILEADMRLNGLTTADYYLTMTGDGESAFTGKNAISIRTLFCSGYLPDDIIPGDNLILLNSLITQSIFANTPMILYPISPLSSDWYIAAVYASGDDIDSASIQMGSFGLGWCGTAADVLQLLYDNGITADRILSVSLYVGEHCRNYFIREGSPDLTIRYRNCFNCIDYAAISAKSTRKLSSDVSTAVCSGKVVTYDVNNTVSWEVQTSELTEQEALLMMHILCSHEVAILLHGEWVNVVITDRTYEVSNANDENYTVKFTYRFAVDRPVIDIDSLDDEFYHNRIFTTPYSQPYS
jgi:hypothetical protein